MEGQVQEAFRAAGPLKVKTQSPTIHRDRK
jgi:hypothetical protein